MAKAQKTRVKTTPKNRAKGNLSDSLIELAVKHIAKTKELDFALRDLAARLGVSHAAAYKHFKSKHDLLESIALKGFSLLNARFEQVLAESQNPVQDLGKAYIEFGLKNPGYYRVMFGVKFGTHESGETREICLKGFYTLLESIGPRNSERAFKALHAWALVHGLVMLLLNGHVSSISEEFKIDPKDIESGFMNITEKILKS